MNKRTIFYISDGTGLTTESLGQALMSQFPHVPTEKCSIPYVDSVKKAQAVADRISQTAASDNQRPIVFSTLVNPEVRDIITHAPALAIDFFATFTSQIERELGAAAQRHIGQVHGIHNPEQQLLYDKRIAAIHFALRADDGQDPETYRDATCILVGLSRSGKTPTSLYLAIHYGIPVANYPLTEEDLTPHTLPASLLPYRHKLVGLTIDPRRLHQIRQERRPGSPYASLEQCAWEAKAIQRLFGRYHIPHWDTTRHSIEEIASRIMAATEGNIVPE